MRRRYTSVMRDAGSDATLERGTKALAADTDILLAISFGSVPQGRAGFESDIDVGVWLASGRLGQTTGRGCSELSPQPLAGLSLVADVDTQDILTLNLTRAVQICR